MLLHIFKKYLGGGHNLSSIVSVNEPKTALDLKHPNCVLIVKATQMLPEEEKKEENEMPAYSHSREKDLIIWAKICLNRRDAGKGQSQCLMNVYRWKMPSNDKRMFYILCLFTNQHLENFFHQTSQVYLMKMLKDVQKRSKNLIKPRFQFYAKHQSLEETCWLGICVEDLAQNVSLSHLERLIDCLLRNHMRFKVKEMSKQDFEQLKENFFKQLENCSPLDNSNNCFLSNANDDLKVIDVQDDWIQLNKITLQHFQQWSFDVFSDISCSDQVQKLSVQIPKEFDCRRKEAMVTNGRFSLNLEVIQND